MMWTRLVNEQTCESHDRCKQNFRPVVARFPATSRSPRINLAFQQPNLFNNQTTTSGPTSFSKPIDQQWQHV